ncbi:uncharacterized protein LOC112566790 isoform X1 [Pomacea canaliculata]|uniref:uncharacterized protein LOC112566790 isoform X1 n=1 Tax=Pomacea canaliculata TaxID=400727 RepID=UPI000D736FDA|nr:uncharacterized protein LOC112566790 isoform X1 [Pomacea canaliculata]
MTTTTLSTVMLLMLLVALALGSVLADEPTYPFPVNCEEPRDCTEDQIPYCIIGRDEPVYGHCEIQDAICDGEEWDPSNSCFLPYAISCDEPADDRECARDARPWCVVGRARPVRGHCAIQEAICDENAVLDINNRCLQ